jgi:hypothetical protein
MIEQYYRPKYVYGQDLENSENSNPDEERSCPACRRIDQVSKVSAIARSSRGRLVLEDGTSAAYESELGSILGRPARPMQLPTSALVSAFVVGWVLLGVTLAAVALLQGQESVSVPQSALEMATYLGLGWFGLVIPGAALLRYFVRREAANNELPVWRDDIERWQSFQYCSRDDLVYVPGEGHGVAPEHVGVLYQRAPSPAVIRLRQKEAQA